MNVPGAVFLIFAILTYGYFWGILISYITALLCAMINFLFARFIGGKALSEIKNKRIQRALSKVETNPISTLFWLRMFLLLSPVVNYAMALTNIKFKHFFIGNVIAMLFPFVIIIAGTVFFRSVFFKDVICAWVVSIFV
ncbi:VTT domain-containing protein [Aureispira]|nr:VTT domain-containing protein [Aureispira sp.]